MIYKEVRITEKDPVRKEIITALLMDIGFAGIEENGADLIAFSTAENFDRQALEQLAGDHHFHFSVQDVQQKNWNEQWESGFQPVVIEDGGNKLLRIRASFHEPDHAFQQEIIITPKMSFGTGHHATTYLMARQMLSTDFRNTTVFDFGTGTGVLAILAEKLGATEVYATDNDEWSIQNATENLPANRCNNVSLELSSNVPAGLIFDRILANINLNVLLENMQALSSALKTGGLIMFSGILSGDRHIMEEAFIKSGLKMISSREKNGWLVMTCEKLTLR